MAKTLSTAPAPELPGLARFASRARRPAGLASALADALWRQRWWLLLDALVLAAGITKGRWVWIAFGLIGAAFPFALTFWRWRSAGRYKQLLTACAVGDWALVRQLVPLLRQVGQAAPLMDFDLDIRLACADARAGHLAAAMAALEPWRARLAEHEGLYDCRLAAVALAGGDTAMHLQLMAAADTESAGDPARRLDHALALARFGDAGAASIVLGGIDVSQVPAHAVGFVAWVRGLVQLRGGDAAAALATLGGAVAEFLRLAAQPASWTALAFCASDHALALHRTGQSAAARRQVADVWPVLGAHAPPALLQLLAAEGLLPAAAAPNLSPR